VNNSGYPATF